jgi:hypothetical protein
MSSQDNNDDRKPSENYAWEGGGKRPHDGPPTEGRDLIPEWERAGGADHEANVNQSDFYHDRRVPGGETPAHTPGGTGPSTRDTDHAVADDANEDVMKRVELGGRLREPFEQGDK